MVDAVTLVENQGPGVIPEEHPYAIRQNTGLVGTVAAIICSLAIASVPVFSNSQELSIIPQALAALGAVLALLTLVKRVPSVHVAVLAYSGLVLFLGDNIAF